MKTAEQHAQETHADTNQAQREAVTLREIAKEGPGIVERMRKAGLHRDADIVAALAAYYRGES